MDCMFSIGKPKPRLCKLCHGKIRRFGNEQIYCRPEHKDAYKAAKRKAAIN